MDEQQNNPQPGAALGYYIQRRAVGHIKQNWTTVYPVGKLRPGAYQDVKAEYDRRTINTQRVMGPRSHYRLIAVLEDTRSGEESSSIKAARATVAHDRGKYELQPERPAAQQSAQPEFIGVPPIK